MNMEIESLGVMYFDIPVFPYDKRRNVFDTWTQKAYLSWDVFMEKTWKLRVKVGNKNEVTFTHTVGLKKDVRAYILKNLDMWLLEGFPLMDFKGYKLATHSEGLPLAPTFMDIIKNNRALLDWQKKLNSRQKFKATVNSLGMSTDLMVTVSVDAMICISVYAGDVQFFTDSFPTSRSRGSLHDLVAESIERWYLRNHGRKVNVIMSRVMED